MVCTSSNPLLGFKTLYLKAMATFGHRKNGSEQYVKRSMENEKCCFYVLLGFDELILVRGKPKISKEPNSNYYQEVHAMNNN